MIKRKFILTILIVASAVAYAQQSEKDSLLAIINKHIGDTTEVNALSYLGNQSGEVDSANKYARLGLSLAEKINYRKGKADCYLVFAGAKGREGDFPGAIRYCLDAIAIFKELKFYPGIAMSDLILQSIYRDGLEDYRSALDVEFSGMQIMETYDIRGYIGFPGHRLLPLVLAEIGQTYVLMKKTDSALIYIQKSIEYKEPFNGAEWSFPFYLLATVQNMQGKYGDALENYRKALSLTIQNDILHDTLQIFAGMSTLFKNNGQLDSAIHYAQIVANGWESVSEYKNLLEALNNLAQFYKLKGNTDSALKYVELSLAIRDSLFTSDKAREVQKITYEENLKQQQLIADQLKYKSRVQLYALLAGLLILLLIMGILWRNNLQKQKAKLKIEYAYNELKSTQSQLIQSEKMASLGELTAGIAHEIQNPLNFVNNFSEVSNELISEMVEEVDKGKTIEVKALAEDVKQNLEKILHHGKRADSIVKSMLQHSQTSTGKKEPTDINALANECLRLSYNGLRAKDKTFNSEMKTDFDETIGKINIVPQDISRVLINLLNNAFYAVTEKKKITDLEGFQNLQGLAAYKPTVSVSTKKINDKIEIRVRDNGSGIPQKIVDKIFQPFFTTKPTGQGTGLGLSLSYDIIKAHGGEIKVESKEGEGAEFVIWVPV